MCHTASYYYWGKDPTFAFGTAVPFGLNCRMQNAWMYDGGGIDLMNEFYAKHQISRPAGRQHRRADGRLVSARRSTPPTTCRASRCASADSAARSSSKLGVVPQQIAGGEIYPALEKGTHRCREWVGPYDDEKLGFHKVAKYYYYPGWWEGGAMLHVLINLEKWNSLPQELPGDRARRGPARPTTYMRPATTSLNPAALKRLVAAGAQLRPFREAVLDACFKAANEIYADITAENEDFKKIYESMMAFRADQYLWFQLSEYTFDTFMMSQQRKKML